MPDFFSEIRKRVASKFSFQSDDDILTDMITTQEYKQFKFEEQAQQTTRFERYCVFSRKFLKFLKLKEKSYNKLKEKLLVADINLDPNDVYSAFVFTLILGVIASVPVFLFGWHDIGYFIILVTIFVGYNIFVYPNYAAEITRIRAQQESLLAIVYMTIYLRVNPVFENSIYFATKHLSGPLGKDLKRILWMLESEKVSTIEQGIQKMVDLWVKRNNDFVESLMILKTVVEQPNQEEQERILNKALSSILTSTYNKMKEYAHNLTTPVTLLYTFGIMLPLIGLIAFPLLSIFMADSIKISYLFFGYIVVLPALIFFYSRRIISKRPGAFSFPDLTGNPYVPPKGTFRLKTKNRVLFVKVWPIAFLTGLIIALPGLYHLIFKTIPSFISAKNCNLEFGGQSCIPSAEYATGNMFLTLLIPLGLAVFFIIYFYGRSYQKLIIRKRIVEIEDDLSSGLFRMSNEFTEKIPIESAISNFIRQYTQLNLEKKSMYQFFSELQEKMQNEGIALRQAVFNKKDGMILQFPSVILKEIMWIIVEGERKGAAILKNITQRVSEYLDNVNNVKQIIFDLLIDTVNAMSLEAKFLAPFIAALVGSLSLVIIKVLFDIFTRLEEVFRMLASGGALGAGASSGGTSFFIDLINFTKITPPTLFQVLVGIYMIEAVLLLSNVANGIQWGFDDVSRDNLMAKNLLFAIAVYLIIILVGTILLNSLIARGASIVGA